MSAKLAVGDRASHHKFGVGEVVGYEENGKYLVKFGDETRVCRLKADVEADTAAQVVRQEHKDIDVGPSIGGRDYERILEAFGLLGGFGNADLFDDEDDDEDGFTA